MKHLSASARHIFFVLLFVSGKTFAQAPVITSFTPTSAPGLSIVHITGLHFTGVTDVIIGPSLFGIIQSHTDTDIFVMVPPSQCSGTITVITPAGNASKPGFTFLPPPMINSFSPISASIGAPIFIFGTGFSNATNVTVNGTSMPFSVINSTQITVTLSGNCNPSGNITVTTPYGTASLGTFTLNGPPDITSFSPQVAGPGMTITINGHKLTGTQSVYFGGTPATSYTVVSDSVVTAVVGSGSSGDIHIHSLNGDASISDFTVTTLPIITSFSPTAAMTGTTVTISGANFTSTYGVWFGSTLASSFTVVSPNKITAIVGNGSSGSVFVATPVGFGNLPGFTYLPPPSITSFTPASGGPNTTITINGTNFNNVTAVAIGGTPAKNFVIMNATQIVATVGAGSSGNITLTNPYGTGSMGTFTFAGPPSIAAVSPAYAAIGATVNISGSGFSPVQANNIVYFGAVKATIVASSATAISVKVPVGASYQPVTVSNLDNNLSAAAPYPFSVKFPGGGVFDASSFTPKIDIPVTPMAYSPNHIALADFDEDGATDVAEVNSNSTGLMIYRSNGPKGTISFDAPVSFLSSIDGTNGIVARDIDGDGKTDIIAINSASLSITVLKNTSTAGTVSFAVQPDGIAIADMDMDGRPDLLLSLQSDANVSIYQNLSAGGIIKFVPAGNFYAGNINANAILADMDGDGKPDIVSPKSVFNSIGLLRNTSIPGTISFATVSFITSLGGTVNDVSVGDLDGDGKPEIAVSISGSVNRAAIVRNLSTSGSLAFAAPVNINAGTNPYGIAITDLEGDGKPDIAVTNTDDATVSVFRNTSSVGTISFNPKVDYATGTSPGRIAIADLDKDGRPDIVTINQSNFAGTFSILKGLSAFSLPVTWSYFNGHVTGKMISLDWQTLTEENTDHFIVEYSTDGNVFTRLGTVAANGNSNFSRNYNFIHTSPQIGSNYYRLAIVDKDGQTAYSKVLKIDISGSTSTLSAYPVPARDMVTIQYPNSPHEGALQLMNAAGQVLRTIITEKNTYQLSLPVNKYPAGIYKILWTDHVKTATITLLIE